MNIDLDFLTQVIETQIPIHKLLGLKIVSLRKDYVKVKVPFSEVVLGDIVRKRWHGGILATIMDSIGGIVGMTHFTSIEDRLATIDLRVDYLKGAPATAIVVEGETVRLGNRILVTNMKVWNEEENTVLAEGRGVYNFVRMKEEPIFEENAFIEKT